MNKVFLLIACCGFFISAHTQKLAQVTFSNASDFSYFSFLTDQGVLIRVSDDGKVLEWGTEVLADYGGYYHPTLQPFLARVDYYGKESDAAMQGKVKSIGTCVLNYYTSFEPDEKAGKLRSVGRVLIDYYSKFDNEAFTGRMKTIGSLPVSYYSSFEDEWLRKKLKSLGTTQIEYHSSFDDKSIRGKLKSIGHVKYAWYTSYDKVGYQGAMKSGNYRQDIAGITYILR